MYQEMNNFNFFIFINNICICLCKGSLTQAIRNFAKSLENWLKGAMTGVPEEMVKTKVRCALLLHFKIKRVCQSCYTV